MKKILFSLIFSLLAVNYTFSQTYLSEIHSSPFSVSVNKTFHLIFPTEVKYFSIGDESVVGEIVESYRNTIRLKSLEPFSGETNMSVVTADGQYYSYKMSYVSELHSSYEIVGKEVEVPPILSVNDNQQMHLIFSSKIIYVDFGTTDVEVIKASGVDNILAIRASGKFSNETNVSVVTADNKFYTFNLSFSDHPGQLSFIVDPDVSNVNPRIALLDNKELNSVQRDLLRDQVNARFQSLNKENKDFAGIRFSITNVFVDGDILIFKFKIINYSNIDYVPDFVRFYIQDSKIRKKTAIQQIEQIPLFFFDLPERILAHETKTFSVALNKFTIPDKKKLIVEMQEFGGGRHFYHKVKNNLIINAEILSPSVRDSHQPQFY
ncbi:conjugative transposon protein TraN [Bacteroides sp. 51]|uniref:conjugative transposon protein TraN n=1 Tax=Bacteroides sp. 51 TaxID=2302938 RepID=UPI0013D67908|nr:conjugative transposon protein TraN [Bacteroides sp. 51]NDV83441.1 conjugative transposon protein TraN [Bacteroides sp. 51]